MAGRRVAARPRPDQAPAAAAARLAWMDTLRVTAIAGVIVMHAATAYILDIDWYYQERTTSALTPAGSRLGSVAVEPGSSESE